MSESKGPDAKTDIVGIFVEGQWQRATSGQTHEVISPVTEELVATVPMASAEDAARAAQSARRAFDTDPWPRLTMAERAEYLRRVAGGLERRVEELAACTVAELGTPLVAARQRVLNAVSIWRATADSASALPGAEDRALPGDRIARVLRVPVGAVLVITPWNAPLPLASMKISAALAAGCTVVLKPASEAPFTLPILADVMAEAGVPAGVFNLLLATPEVTAELTRHPDLDMVTFTGSTQVGKQVMRACSESMKRVALELGGKSASVVTEDVEPEDIVPRLLAITGMSLAGQTCASRNRILVPRSRKEQWESAIAEAVGKLRVGPPSDAAADVGPLATRAQRDRVERYIALGTEQGARLLVGGRRPPGLDRGWYVEPTVFADVDPEMTIAQEEIFGPVLTVIPYDDDEHAIAISNSTVYGLSGAVFCGDPERGMRIAQGVRSGTFQINSTGSLLDGPFGGMKQSGIGRESGLEGIEEFCEIRQIQFPTGAVAPVAS